MTFVFPILMIGFLILIHELGHYLVGRHYGAAVRVFCVGFGPSWTLKKDRNGTEWKLALFPFGGYVGFLPRSLYEDATNSEFVGPPTQASLSIRRLNGLPFDDISLPKRLQVLLAGPVVNLLAIYPLIFLFLLFLPDPVKQNEISDPFKNFDGFSYSEMISRYNEVYDANVPSLKPGDRISEVNGRSVLTEKGISAQLKIAELQGIKEIDILVDKRYATEHEYELSLDDAQTLIMLFNFKPSESFSNAYRIVLHDFIRSSFDGFVNFPAVIKHQMADPNSIDTTQAHDDSSPSKKAPEPASNYDQAKNAAQRVNAVIHSPVMMVKNQSDALSRIKTLSGQVALLLIAAAVISFNIGILNLLPFSFLDGGQVIVHILEKIKDDGVLNTIVHRALMTGYNLISHVIFLLFILFAIGGDIWEVLT